MEGSDEGDSDVDLDSFDSDDGGGVDIEGIEDAVDHGEGRESDVDANIWSDEESLVESDEETPGNLHLASDFELEDQRAESSMAKQGGKSKRRKLKHLPTFASVDDYAEMLARDGDED